MFEKTLLLPLIFLLEVLLKKRGVLRKEDGHGISKVLMSVIIPASVLNAFSTPPIELRDWKRGILQSKSLQDFFTTRRKNMASKKRETQRRKFAWKDTLFWVIAASVIIYIYFFIDQSQGKFFSWHKQFALSRLRSLNEKYATPRILTRREHPTIYRHSGSLGECDPERCPPHHWQKEGNLTLTTRINDLDYHIIQQKRPRRYFLFVRSQLAKNEWLSNRIDSTRVFQIRQARDTFIAYPVLARSDDDGLQPLTSQGYTTYQQALDDYCDLDDEAVSGYEMWLAAEGDLHEQEREAKKTLWEAQYDPSYVDHLLANWDTWYYNQADENLQAEISAGLHDEKVRQRDEYNRQALARRYCSSPSASWPDITDAIWRQHEALRVGLPASANWQQIEVAWQHNQQKFGTNEIP